MNRAVVLLLLLSAAGLGRIIHVPSEYPTIQQGIDAAASGDIVMVAAGRYVEEITLKAGVVVQGAGEERSTIDGNGDAGDVVRAIGNSIRNDCRLVGFTVTGARNSGGMPGGGGLFCNSGAQPEIANCRFTGNDAGIALWNGSSAFIHNCVVAKNIYDGISTGCFATIVNNTIHANRIGFYDYSGYGPVFMNNIVTGHSMYGVYGPSGGTPPSLTYNDVWGNATNYQQATPGTGSMSHDPLYADTAAGDYHLQFGSPCIDSGNPAAQYNDPDGSRNDIGAYGGPGAVSNRPEVTSLDPAQNALNVAPDVTVTAGFNLDMDVSTLSPQTVRLLGAWSGWHWGTVEYDSSGRTVALEPEGEFFPGEPATALLSKGITTETGDSLPGFAWDFTTRVAGGSGLFNDTNRVRPWGNTAWLATADFDSDGHLDLGLVRDNANQFAVFLGTGGARFPDTHYVSVSTGPRACACADFDSDSVLDVAVTSSGSGNVSVLIGRGDGSFDPPVTYPCGSMPQEAAAVDYDLDGDLDLAVPAYGSDSLYLLDNEGDGTFAPARPVACADNPGSIAAADLDNDGRPDLLVANYGSNDIAVLLGSGDGTFSQPDRYAAGTTPCFVRAGDFSEDGSLDAVAVNMTSHDLSVWTGDGSGGLGTRVNYALHDSPRQVVVADLDADSHLDLAATDKTGNTVTVFRGRGDGVFLAGIDWEYENDPLPLAAGDFDEDGDLDLAVGNYTPQQVTVMLNDNQLLVTGTLPAQYEAGSDSGVTLRAGFSAAVLPSSLDSTSWRTWGTLSGRQRGAIGFDSSAWFDPQAGFAHGEQVFSLLTKAVRTPSGVALKGFGWTFFADPGGNNSGAYDAQQRFATGGEPRGVAAADFDGDGDVDIATTSNSPAAVALLRNSGGSLGSPEYTPVALDPISLFCADLDWDADVDIACFHNQPGSSHLEILLNNGNGSFTVAHDYAPAVLGHQVSGADFDADGDVDLVLADGWGSQNNVRVMTNNGSGAFSGPVSYSGGSWTHGCTAIDAENDGDWDIAVANNGNNNVTVLYNSGSGIFDHSADFNCGSSPDRLFCFDLNGDSFADVATANYGEDSVSVLLNDRAGGFGTRKDWYCGGGTQAIAGGLLSHPDRAVDLVLSVANSDQVAVLQNDGSGGFPGLQFCAVGDLPWGIALADFDLDGSLDIACSNYSTDDVSLLFDTGLGIAERPTVGLERLAVRPGLFRDRCEIRWSVAAGRAEALSIVDASGRVVRNVTVAGSGRMTWDGTDGSGRRLAAGVYFVRLDGGAEPARVVIAR